MAAPQILEFSYPKGEPNMKHRKTDDDRPRERKRSRAAKSQTIDRKRQRAAKRTIREGR